MVIVLRGNAHSAESRASPSVSAKLRDAGIDGQAAREFITASVTERT